MRIFRNLKKYITNNELNSAKFMKYEFVDSISNKKMYLNYHILLHSIKAPKNGVVLGPSRYFLPNIHVVFKNSFNFGTIHADVQFIRFSCAEGKIDSFVTYTLPTKGRKAKSRSFLEKKYL